MLEEEREWRKDLIGSLRSNWTLGNLLAEKAQRNRGRVFLRFQDQSFTYEEFEEKSSQAAQALLALGLKKGDKVGILMANCPEFLFLWFGIAKMGAVMVPYNVEWKGELLSFILQHSDTQGMILHQEFWPQLHEVLPVGRPLDFLVISGDEDRSRPNGAMDLRDLFTGPADFHAPHISPQDPFQIMYTSGTTGRSKGVVRWHEYVILRALRAVRIMGYRPEDVLYTPLPLYHGNAQVFSTLPALLANATLALGKRFSAREFWNDIRAHKATTFNYIGAMLSILYKQPPTDRDSDHQVRFARGAGAPAEIFLDFEKRFHLELVESYGTTEGGTVQNAPGRRKVGSFGTPPYYNEAVVIDEEGKELPRNKVGEMIIRPKDPGEKWLEYYKEPDATAEKVKNGWYHTGDLALVDEDGYFFFKGRKKDAIRRRGENVSAQEVEKVINAHPAVLECAAYGVPAELSEEEIMVAVSLKPGFVLTPADLIGYCHNHMARFMVPRYVEFMDSLPKTPSLRVEKYKLQKRGVTPNTWDREKNKIVP
jgi:crotonobetaine/carnitine-CoA ligase